MPRYIAVSIAFSTRWMGGAIAIFAVSFASASLLAACSDPEPQRGLIATLVTESRQRSIPTSTHLGPTPGLMATLASKNYEEATVVANVVRSIQATNTAERNIETCLRQPLSCKSLGLDWQRIVKNCHATVEANPIVHSYSDCSSDLLRNPPTVLPAIQPPDNRRPQRPSRR